MQINDNRFNVGIVIIVFIKFNRIYMYTVDCYNAIIHCTLFQIFTRIIKIKSTHADKFLDGPEMKQLKQNVTKAVGLDTTLPFGKL